jgi:all-trans-8'-apo-beta-carotenal 15,15'-oxygenase
MLGIGHRSKLSVIINRIYNKPQIFSMSFSTDTPSWQGAFKHPAPEFTSTELPIVAGEIPLGLQGNMYRNGPGRFGRGGVRVGHWFDGDGAVLKVAFTDGAANGVYRYVQTAGYLAEAEADRLLYAGYGTIGSKHLYQRLQRGVKNTANTSVLPLPDKLLALWEGGNPHALDLDTLATMGIDNLGLDRSKFAYSAHPKIDPDTGFIYNFGISTGLKVKLHIYQSDCSGKVIEQNAIALPGIVMIHDFCLAGKYLVFCIPPLRASIPLLMLGKASFGESLKWQPELGTEIVIFDRDTLELVSRNTVEPWYQWHFCNGYVDDAENIIIDLISYQDFTTDRYLAEIVTGKITTDVIGTLWQLTIDPQSGKLIYREELSPRGCELPEIDRTRTGKNWRYSYLSTHRTDIAPTGEMLTTISRFDRQDRTMTTANLDAHLYASTPIYAPDRSSNGGWVLTVIYDSKLDCSQLWVFDRDRLDESPACILQLPSIVPMGFHGAFVAS